MRRAAKDLARTMLHKNPNCYFYRHTAPGVPQHMGDWTEEEHRRFVAVAKALGCGDKWGLFSTYIPHRVGYQCSNYYRQVILRDGSVVDPNYHITSSGLPVFVGGGPSRDKTRKPSAAPDLSRVAEPGCGMLHADFVTKAAQQGGSGLDRDRDRDVPGTGGAASAPAAAGSGDGESPAVAAAARAAADDDC